MASAWHWVQLKVGAPLLMARAAAIANKRVKEALFNLTPGDSFKRLFNSVLLYPVTSLNLLG